jgi:ADP-heptose:LPS heptosyltransferase
LSNDHGGPLTGQRRVCVFARLWEPGLGDLIQREIFLDLLKQACPGAEVTLVVGPAAAERFAEFFARHSRADRVLSCPEYGDEDPGRWDRFRAAVASEGYGCCLVDPDSRGLGAEQASRCGIGIRIGFATGQRDDRYLTRPVRLPAAIFGLPDLLDFARALAGAVGVAAPAPEAAVPWFRFTGQPVPALPSPVVAMHPGGARHWNRRWPLARFGELGRRLAAGKGEGEVGGASLVLLGPAEEAADLAELAGLAGAGAVAQVCAGAPLDTVASWLAAADVLVGNDSALAHIAAALRTPTVVLYGPGMTEFMWTRVYLRHDGINRHYECQTVRNLPRGPGVTTMPCRHSCHYPYESAAGPYPRCLTDIPVDTVHQAVLRQLARGRRAPAAAGREA